MAADLVVDRKVQINNQNLDSDTMDKLFKIKVGLSLESIGVAKLSFVDPDGSLQKKADFYIGKSASVSLGYAEATKIFTGEIIRIDYKFVPSQTPTLELVCYDKLFKLSRKVHSRPFIQKKDSDIAKTMASEAGLQSSIDATTQTHEYIFQNNESNLQFLRRRAKLIGYEVAVDDGKFIFKQGRFKDNKKSVTLDREVDLVEFQVTIDGSDVVEEAVASSWDPVKKEAVEQKSAAGAEPKIGTAAQKGTSQVKSKLSNTAKSYVQDIPNLAASEATAIAKSTLTAASRYFLSAKGRCAGEPKIIPGKLLEIKNFGDKISGDYYITSCEHVYHMGSYETHFEVTSNGLAK